ncbi:SEC-C metal-binding domain-containing protein [Sutcliffiella sp. NC1]|uniref:SEC-C metal-binding domain-containing protein n=1 Tax=Sutcliffiella sp. NC1 TaxID=3004096 RepID=UPI0022DE3C0A|nr:SEC-C metal-binding domain-containing protein [Sutcliffiella sp. NC1]WBL17710.1 SEC-C metal-binding domain-containing protein [Sutcliffiella sp. NC1]
MQESREFEAEEFDLSLKAYMNYIARKMKKDKLYYPHPLIKSLMVAIEGAIEKGEPGRYAGASGDAEHYPDKESRKSFFCIIDYNKDKTFTLIEFHDITLKKSVPIKVASFIILLSMKLDKISGSNISVEDSIRVINETIPFLNLIRFNNDDWKEARDYFSKNINRLALTEEQKIVYREQFRSITMSTPWEEYPQSVRILIATSFMQERYPQLNKRGKVNLINIFLDEYYPKIRIINDTLTMLYGPISQYFNEIPKWNHFSDTTINENKFKKSEVNIGRNDKCPCNSGKKFKKCCGKH